MLPHSRLAFHPRQHTETAQPESRNTTNHHCPQETGADGAHRRKESGRRRHTRTDNKQRILRHRDVRHIGEIPKGREKTAIGRQGHTLSSGTEHQAEEP